MALVYNGVPLEENPIASSKLFQFQSIQHYSSHCAYTSRVGEIVRSSAIVQKVEEPLLVRCLSVQSLRNKAISVADYGVSEYFRALTPTETWLGNMARKHGSEMSCSSN